MVEFEYEVEIDCRRGAAVMLSGSHERAYHVGLHGEMCT
jgi:hypothetical protein